MDVTFWSYNQQPVTLIYHKDCKQFQCLPIFLPKSFFVNIDSIIFSIICEGKCARVRRPELQRSRLIGGLSLPNLTSYYWAAHTHKIMLWFTLPQSNWCPIETKPCSSSSLQALVCSSLPPSPSNFMPNPIVIGTLEIWAQIRRHFNWLCPPQAMSTLNDHLFLPAKTDPRFASLERNGLSSLKDMYKEGTFASFE